MNDNYVSNNFYYMINGEMYQININTNLLFKGLLMYFFKKGIKINKFQVPSHISSKIPSVEVNKDNKYVFFISVPNGYKELATEFSRKISRFIYGVYTDEEYEYLKKNNMVAVEVKFVERKEDFFPEEYEQECNAISSLWRLEQKYDNKVLYDYVMKVENYWKKLKKYLDDNSDCDNSDCDNSDNDILNLSDLNESLEKELKELIQENPKLFKDLSKSMGVEGLDDTDWEEMYGEK